MSKENIQLLWNISLAVLAVCSVILGLTALLDADLPDGLERLLGMLDLIALPVFLIYPALIVRRISNEEHVLTEERPGYSEYKKKVKYKLFPRIW